jgi:hypothetical protein
VSYTTNYGTVMEPLIVAATLGKNQVLENGFTTAHFAAGSITITKQTATEVAGSFDAQFVDGSTAAGTFDVPVCSHSCGLD